MMIRNSSLPPFSVDYGGLACLLSPLPPASSTMMFWEQAEREHNGKGQKKEAGEDFVEPFAAVPKGWVSKSGVQGTFFFPFLSSSDRFLGLFSLLEQNPDSVPCTCERIITSVPSKRQACCQQGGVGWGCKCS